MALYESYMRVFHSVCDGSAASISILFGYVLSYERGGSERMGPRPPPWVPLLKNLIIVAVSFPPV